MKSWPKGYWFYGWDYAHAGDYCDYYDKPPLNYRHHSDDKKWLVGDVEKDSWGTLYDLKKLMTLAEKIKSKTP
jgi:hypothetical protein